MYYLSWAMRKKVKYWNDVQIEDGDVNAITFANCPVGILPVMAVRLMDETTAGSVLAGY